jgi:hypothetical protein
MCTLGRGLYGWHVQKDVPYGFLSPYGYPLSAV